MQQKLKTKKSNFEMTTAICHFYSFTHKPKDKLKIINIQKMTHAVLINTN